MLRAFGLALVEVVLLAPGAYIVFDIYFPEAPVGVPVLAIFALTLLGILTLANRPFFAATPPRRLVTPLLGIGCLLAQLLCLFLFSSPYGFTRAFESDHDFLMVAGTIGFFIAWIGMMLFAVLGGCFLLLSLIPRRGSL